LDFVKQVFHKGT